MEAQHSQLQTTPPQWLAVQQQHRLLFHDIEPIIE
jgi:hypothetical protein